MLNLPLTAEHISEDKKVFDQIDTSHPECLPHTDDKLFDAMHEALCEPDLADDERISALLYVYHVLAGRISGEGTCTFDGECADCYGGPVCGLPRNVEALLK